MSSRKNLLSRISMEVLESRQLLSGTAAFLGVDAATQGSWSGHYGADGYSIAQTTPSLPTYATVSTTGTPTNWTLSTADARALQDPASLSNHAATAWYDPSSFSYDVNIVGGAPKMVSLYAVDFDSTSRSETVTITDPSTGGVLDTRTLSNFNGGEYLSYNISGEVDITVTKTAGANAVVSGLFFDPTGAIAPPNNLQAIASPGQVEMTWTAAPSGGTYNVVRSDSDGNATTIATGVTGTSYTDTSVTNGQTFSYAVGTSSGGIAGPSLLSVVKSHPAAYGYRSRPKPPIS